MSIKNTTKISKPISAMKNKAYLSLLIVLFFVTAQANAQDVGPIDTPVIAQSAVNYNPNNIVIPGVNEKLVNRMWATYVRRHLDGKVKYDRRSKEFMTPTANVREMSGFPVSLTAQSRQIGGDVSFSVYPGAPIVEVPKNSSAALAASPQFTAKGLNMLNPRGSQELLAKFAKEVRREQVRLLVRSEEHQLNKFEANLRHLKSDNQRYLREIKYSEDRIRKAKESIIKNETDQQQAQQRILNQQKALENAKKLMSGIY
jgi:hypothetical protein